MRFELLCALVAGIALATPSHAQLTRDTSALYAPDDLPEPQDLPALSAPFWMWALHKEWLFASDGVGFRSYHSEDPSGDYVCHACGVHLVLERLRLDASGHWKHNGWYTGLDLKGGAWGEPPHLEVHRLAAVDLLVMTHVSMSGGFVEKSIVLHAMGSPSDESQPTVSAHALERVETFTGWLDMPESILLRIDSLGCPLTGDGAYGSRYANLAMTLDSAQSSITFQFDNAFLDIECPCHVPGMESIRAKLSRPDESKTFSWPFDDMRLDWDIRQFE
ncbi:hypothetical protein N9098_01720 [bacterium]|nr:hypothetical protein [bacterium]